MGRRSCNMGGRAQNLLQALILFIRTIKERKSLRTQNCTAWSVILK